MAYVPPPGSAINLGFSGAYTPPAGGLIAFSFQQASGVVVSASFDLRAAIGNQKTWTADSKAVSRRSLSGSYDTIAEIATTSIVSASFDARVAVSNIRHFETGTGAAVSLVRPPPNPDFDVPWGQKPTVDARAGSGWKERHAIVSSIGMGWIKRLVVNAGVGASWRDKGAADKTRRSSWGEQGSKIGRSTFSRWRSRKSADLLLDAGWDVTRSVDVLRGNRVFSPPSKDFFVTFSHGVKVVIDRALFEIPWGSPPPKDQLHRTVWGRKYYKEICWRHYEPLPGGGLNFNLHVPITLVDDGDHIRFRFDQFTYDRRCSWREPSGWRDPYFYRPPAVIPTGPWASVYVMLNTAYLTRLPERTPIDITGLTIGTDWDSLYWTLKATVGSDASLALLEPTTDGPVLVEASVNGHVWKFQVDKWTKNEAFGSRGRSVDGRSISAQLGAPMAEIRTYTEAEARTALQLMNNELEFTGWEVVLDGLDDWLVPGGVHSYQDQTPMQVIKLIADTCRAMVQTDMAAETIRIKPRYKVKPWAVATATPDLIIPASMTARVDGEWDERPLFNAVHVSGEAGGISARIIRTGTEGDLLAPMVTSKLITATEAARALGIAVLGASGKWSKHRIELPVFASPSSPGVIQPGAIIEYNLGTSSWRGFVTAVSVSAPRTKDGLKVRQTIDVERYHGN